MKIFVMSVGNAGLDTVKTLSRKIAVSGVIGLKDTNTKNVSGYFAGKAFCETLGIPYFEAEDYSLRTDSDRQMLLNLPMDVLFVLNWQRLIPDWLIHHCTFGAVGFHGSPWGITAGRGRSPQNWALLLGKSTFSLSMFTITPHIDDGNILDTREFTYSVFDDIATSKKKVSILSAHMIIEYIQNIPRHLHGTPQNSGVEKYLPQRKPEDGAIDWNRSTMDIYNFIRALTHPYPGAFTTVHGTTLRIWRARPFTLSWAEKIIPGKILKVFVKGDFLVGTHDGVLIVDEYTYAGDIQKTEELICTSVCYNEQLQNILQRHSQKYPQHTIQQGIIAPPDDPGGN